LLLSKEGEAVGWAPIIFDVVSDGRDADSEHSTHLLRMITAPKTDASNQQKVPDSR
jgi:hypothetical protein